MRKIQLLTTIFFFIKAGLFAQENDTIEVKQLDSIVIMAFEQGKSLQNVPAPVGYLNNQMLNRFGNASVVSAINTLPGIKMEERSPGSYRINIRGSSLRSPFGVRNVKIYYNDLPFTDPGGNTYLNSLGYFNYNSIEIVKGPASSMYGAGTGGALIINSINKREVNGITGVYTLGSFGLQNIYTSLVTGENNKKSKIGFQHLQSNGYRNQSALNKNVFSWDGNYNVFTKGILKTSFLFSNLFYETPGALTISEYNLNPKAARPGAGAFPSAEDANAAIYQNTLLVGFSLHHPVAKDINNKTSLYGTLTKLRNPAIRNYGINDEPHFGGRSVFTLNKKVNDLNVIINTGGEWQKGNASFSVYKNKNGTLDSLQTQDEVDNNTTIVFLQTTVESKNWEVTAGTSTNTYNTEFQRLYPGAAAIQKRNLKNEWAPRLALLYKAKTVNIYSSISKGFSPPTTSELLPTGSAINLNLEAEQGINYDLGAKGNLFKGFSFDINAFFFRLNNTIVQRRDAGGGDYYVNSGKTKQYGLESFFNYQLFKNPFVHQSKIWISHTWTHFLYDQFKQQNNDYSGKQIPGVANNILSAGFDLLVKEMYNTSITYYYSDHIALNDLNSAYAKPYHLLGIKAGITKEFSKSFKTSLAAGADNLLNRHYSLGNDINAFGGRYYNAAPGRNYYITLTVKWEKQKNKKEII